MNRNLKIIIMLLCIAIVIFGVTNFIIIPQRNAAKEKYAIEQRDSLTHDFKNVLKYKSKYMGDASNITNLNYNLPLCFIARTNELDSDNLKYIINYKESPDEIGMDKVKRDLIYNATANFALIDNLEIIRFNFTGNSYEINRSNIQSLYKDKLSELTVIDKWKENVQQKLNDKEYVNSIWEKYFIQ